MAHVSDFFFIKLDRSVVSQIRLIVSTKFHKHRFTDDVILTSLLFYALLERDITIML